MSSESIQKKVENIPDKERPSGEMIAESTVEKATSLFETQTVTALATHEQLLKESGAQPSENFYRTLARLERKGRRVMRRLRAVQGIGSPRDQIIFYLLTIDVIK